MILILGATGQLGCQITYSRSDRTFASWYDQTLLTNHWWRQKHSRCLVIEKIHCRLRRSSQESTQ